MAKKANNVMDRANAPGTITIKDADIFLRNFGGRATKYTPEGTRHFMTRLDDEQAETLERDGWNIAHFRPREPGDPETLALRVWVNYNKWFSPEVYMVIGKTKTLLTEETITLLDNAIITRVDMRIRGRRWGDENRGGVKAYLDKMYVTVEKDELDDLYSFDEEDDGGEIPF